MTKLRSIPDLDLARIAPLPPDQRRNQLEQLKLGRPPYSYRPLRVCILDILSLDAGPLAVGARTPWSQIEARIREESRSEDEITANLAVASALWNHAESSELRGRHHEFFPLPIGMSAKATYWSPAVLVIDGRAVVPFFDPRKAKALTEAGRRFAFSAMHERIRAADPDFAEVGLQIVQFGVDKDRNRIPVFHGDDGVELFSFDELNDMTRETYRVWQEVLEEREERARRDAHGLTGEMPLFRRRAVE